jgi:hypothetical protein
MAFVPSKPLEPISPVSDKESEELTEDAPSNPAADETRWKSKNENPDDRAEKSACHQSQKVIFTEERKSLARRAIDP